MFSNLFPLHPTVVIHPCFYYHLTAIDGIDLPHFAVFCFSRDRVTNCSHLFLPGKSRQDAAEHGFSGGWSHLAKILFVCHGKPLTKADFPCKIKHFWPSLMQFTPRLHLASPGKYGKCRFVLPLELLVCLDNSWQHLSKAAMPWKTCLFLFLQKPTVSFTPFVSTHQARHDTNRNTKRLYLQRLSVRYRRFYGYTDQTIKRLP